LRKLAAILLSGILLFNWIGYRLMNSVLEDSATHHLEMQLDQQQYDEDQLITLKVPITHLSYFNASTTFERVSGEIEVNGTPYRYVKRRILNDSIEVLCIPNAKAFQLRQINNTYFSFVNDISQGAKHDTHPQTSKSFSNDPFTCIQPIQIDAPEQSVLSHTFHFAVYFPTVTLPTDEQPPAFTAA